MLNIPVSKYSYVNSQAKPDIDKYVYLHVMYHWSLLVTL